MKSIDMCNDEGKRLGELIGYNYFDRKRVDEALLGRGCRWRDSIIAGVKLWAGAIC